MNTAKTSTQDRGESISLMQPMRVAETSPRRPSLTDLAVELTAHSAAFRSSLPDGVQTALSDLVRSMNCYYSNLIEGHDTHPVDIERALNNDFSKHSKQRQLQLEAKAHISVQRWIDRGGIDQGGIDQDALNQDKLGTTVFQLESICEIHKHFYELLPPELLQVDHPDSEPLLTVTPGALRTHDVKVGRHIAISPVALPRFMEAFTQAYANQGKAETIISVAAAHHRLLWIHPFLDGNGRVARLMSHAVLLNALDTGGVWSISRGLARNEAAYKHHLAQCDQSRRNDLDGRGHLSEEALAEFTCFFLETCLDQVKFMQDLVRPERLRMRILLWAEEEVRLTALPENAGRILEAILYRGELPRGEVPALLGVGERHARRSVAALIQRKVVVSNSTRAPLHLAFPATLAGRWMPGLFPEQTS